MTLHYERILVALDGSDEAEYALQKGIETALTYESALAFCYIIDYHNIRELRQESPDLLSASERIGTDILNRAKQSAEDQGVKQVLTFLKEGPPKALISGEIAHEFGADLILSGGSGAGTFEKRIFGSVAASIVRHASCDVWIVKNEEPPAPYRSVLIAVDGSEVSTSALYAGLDIAKREKSRVQVVYVLNTPFISSAEYHTEDIIEMYRERGKELLEEYRNLSAAENISAIDFSVEYGAPKIVIPTEAAKKFEADLIVAGSSGMGRAERLFLGSVSESLVRRASCDVLIIRNDYLPK